ncbi:MAG: NADH:flavin oxidoreductase [Desulfobacteraceae bacterium]|nr:NADH:flavin oxidoreductase [Desulfobacteraceae bacterium]
MTHDVLFNPIYLGKKEIKNRIAFAPTGMGTGGPEGKISDQTLCHYVARAKGGAGLIIVEHSIADHKYALSMSGNLFFHQDKNLAGMMDLATSIQAFDAAAVIQLGLGFGRQAFPGMEGEGPSSIPLEIPENSLPKKLKMFAGTTGLNARALSVSEIENLEDMFIDSVSRIKKAGFDGIEIHGAHGYLLASFLSPFTNHRTDKYGGSFEKRITLLLNLVRKSREAAGEDFIIGLRISGDEHIPGGWSVDDTLRLVPVLEKEGIDYIHLSSGTLESWKHTFPLKDGSILPEAEAVKRVAGIPVICPNFHNPSLAAQSVNDEKVDMVSLSRGLLADPQWPNKVKDNRIDEIQKCIRCYECLITLFQGFSTRCAVNPNVGRERFIPEYFPPPRKGKGIPI